MILYSAVFWFFFYVIATVSFFRHCEGAVIASRRRSNLKQSIYEIASSPFGKLRAPRNDINSPSANSGLLAMTSIVLRQTHGSL